MAYSLVRHASSREVIEDCVRRVRDGAFIPRDPENLDWRAYLEWRSNGGTPDDPDRDLPKAVTRLASQVASRDSAAGAS